VAAALRWQRASSAASTAASGASGTLSLAAIEMSAMLAGRNHRSARDSLASGGARQRGARAATPLAATEEREHRGKKAIMATLCCCTPVLQHLRKSWASGLTAGSGARCINIETLHDILAGRQRRAYLEISEKVPAKRN